VGGVNNIFRAAPCDERPVDHLVQLRRLAPQARLAGYLLQDLGAQVVVPPDLE
jgi:hypothetical protein